MATLKECLHKRRTVGLTQNILLVPAEEVSVMTGKLAEFNPVAHSLRDWTLLVLDAPDIHNNPDRNSRG